MFIIGSKTIAVVKSITGIKVKLQEMIKPNISNKSKKSRGLNETPSQSYGVSLAIWYHLPPDTSEHTLP